MAKIRKRNIYTQEELKNDFEYKDGLLYWKCEKIIRGKNIKGFLAGTVLYHAATRRWQRRIRYKGKFL